MFLFTEISEGTKVTTIFNWQTWENSCQSLVTRSACVLHPSLCRVWVWGLRTIIWNSDLVFEPGPLQLPIVSVTMAPEEGPGLMMMFSIRIIEWHGEGYSSCREAWTSQLILHQNSQQSSENERRHNAMQIMREGVCVYNARGVSSYCDPKLSSLTPSIRLHRS